MEWVEGKPRAGERVKLGRADGELYVHARYKNGAAAALSLPRARLPAAGPPADARSALDGAFGIGFGPAGVETVKSLTCPEGEKDGPCLEPMANALFQGSERFRLKEPPRAPAGGRDYSVQVTGGEGVRLIGATVGNYDTC